MEKLDVVLLREMVKKNDISGAALTSSMHNLSGLVILKGHKTNLTMIILIILYISKYGYNSKHIYRLNKSSDRNPE